MPPTSPDSTETKVRGLSNATAGSIGFDVVEQARNILDVTTAARPRQPNILVSRLREGRLRIDDTADIAESCQEPDIQLPRDAIWCADSGRAAKRLQVAMTWWSSVGGMKSFRPLVLF